jgi:hypothetical protein
MKCSWRLSALANTLVAASALLSACGGDATPPTPVDTTAPTLVITDSVAAATASGPVTFTFTFSEDVGTSFIADDVTVTGGAKGAFTKVSATVYTLVVTPTANITGTIIVTVAAGAFSDTANNASTTSYSAQQAYYTVINPVIVASAYTTTDADPVNFARAGRSVEGGSFNWYQDSVLNDWSNFWWSGVSPTTDTPPSFYFGLGLASSTVTPFIGAYVNAPADGSVTLSGQTKLKVAVWGNDELTSRGLPTFTVFVQLKQAFSGCYVEAAAPVITPTGTGARTYELPLSTFTIKNNCTGSGVTTVADFFTKPIGSVHAQVLKANMYFNGPALSPNGINLGPVSFQP